MLESTTFLFGEKKKVCVKVSSVYRGPFEITNAKFALTVGSEVEAQGECELVAINEYEFMLQALVKPMRPGTLYTLTYTYDILPETLVYKMEIRVV